MGVMRRKIMTLSGVDPLLWIPSNRVYQPPAEPDYPFHDRNVRVTRCGRIWLVSFLHFDLGFFDHQEGRVEPAPNPFAPEQV
jgi:putative transposase